ncbi:hypothetical protein GCM10009104_19980 [Marinobacterium maritimum]|uniref:Uncharacterized protein n=1 Tax=Marinobacterium maritimum TaxID=500162 RepID=A0ABP3TBU1_9GAMM
MPNIIGIVMRTRVWRMGALSRSGRLDMLFLWLEEGLQSVTEKETASL